MINGLDIERFRTTMAAIENDHTKGKAALRADSRWVSATAAMPALFACPTSAYAATAISSLPKQITWKSLMCWKTGWWKKD